MTAIKTSLQRHQPDGPADEQHLRDMAAAAWHRHGVVIVRVEEIESEWLRRVLAAEAEQKFGRREKQR